MVQVMDAFKVERVLTGQTTFYEQHKQTDKRGVRAER